MTEIRKHRDGLQSLTDAPPSGGPGGSAASAATDGGSQRLPVLLMSALLFVTGCVNLNPFQADNNLRTTQTPIYDGLFELPQPEQKLVAAVYRFRDQTGQYEPSENISSWSTAVTQGATSILLKAIEDSGWFVPIERESISNLMNERQIIRSIRAEHNQGGPLPPLMYAGIMLEGGIIGYDSNIMTGGAGARYLGIGGSTEFRQDKVTVYLRAVSTQNSRILKTVHSTETILSQKVDAHVFRFVDQNKILEGEAGYTVNEPSTVAVTRAIEKAVDKLVMEGVRDGIWNVAQEEVEKMGDHFAAFETRHSTTTQLDFFGRQMQDWRGKFAFGLNIEGQQYQGNYPDPLARPALEAQALYRFTPRLSAGLSAHRGDIAAKRSFERTYSGAQLKIRGILKPEYTLTPFLELGAGAMVMERESFRFNWDEWYPYVSGTIGLEYMITNKAGLNITVRNRHTLWDGLDGVDDLGGLPDRIWSVGAGLVFYSF